VAATLPDILRKIKSGIGKNVFHRKHIYSLQEYE
jgi:hypothetical protein